MMARKPAVMVGVCVLSQLIYLAKTHIASKIDRPDRWCANDYIVAGTGDQDKKRYAGGPQDQLLSGNTISPLLVRVSHAAVAGVWNTNSYFKVRIRTYRPTEYLELGLI